MNNKAMNGWAITGIVFGVIILLSVMIVSSIYNSYNGLVTKDINTEQKFSAIKVQLERRLDLIPNLARTVKGSSEFEKETLIEVAKARGGIRIANNPSELEEANRPVMSMMAGMMTYTEQYPNIKSTELYINLMDELAGTESRIAWERNEYNKVVQEYKISVRTFPNNIIAGIFNFKEDKWKMYELDNSSATIVPNVEF